MTVFWTIDWWIVPNISIYSAVFLASPYYNCLWSTASTTMICWRCHNNSVDTGSSLPTISEVKTQKKTEHDRNWHDSKQLYYQERMVGIPLSSLTPPQICVCSKPRPGFPTSYVMVFWHSMSSPPVVGSLCSSIFSFLCRALWIIVCTFILFHLVIVVCVLPRFTVSDYAFCIF